MEKQVFNRTFTLKKSNCEKDNCKLWRKIEFQNSIED
jgi:hypothetical protein